MKQAVFDTNIIIDYINGIQEVDNVWDKYERGLLSIISSIEIRVGVCGADIQKMKPQKIIEQFEIIKIIKDVADYAIEIRQRYRLKLPDAIIGATAQSLQILLITRNTKDFKPDWKNIHIPYTFKQAGMDV